MIGVDTNVLVRHLTGDDPQQSPRASAFFAERSAADPAAISIITLVETVWVLTRGYGLSRDRVHAIVRALCRSRDVVVQHDGVVIRALRDADEAGCDLADALIAHLAIDAGADGTVTFDRRAARLPGMQYLGNT
ncbi:putative nucleic-acid-binding protein [Microcella alkaliphila]|uniref:Ribonuclease VapC n=1 Tax=Microcella alkaliphila TaxID=279828 RepID=A0A4Q7TAC7_9MICO|nr:type II toxin-antitoxin system VapC family toxin [Microcella alkaliphila]RZT57375.1 putative nucleic-acid-binding protein [Microcella alkaliphila]